MVGENDQRCEDQNGFDGQSFAIVVVTLGRPLEKLGDVLGQLGLARFRSIAVFDLIIVQLFRHGDVSTAEVRIVVETSFAFHTSRFVLITREEIEDVVATIFAT